MTYSTNSQLPEAVRNALDENQQTEWLEVFNSAYDGTCDRDDEVASKIAWSKMKKHARHFAGWATAEVIDKQGDKIEIDAFKSTMKKFMDLGSTIIDKHSNRKVGSYIGYEFRNKGDVPALWMEGVIYKGHRIHDEVWDKIRKGIYPALSIGADPTDTVRECNEKMCWHAIKKIDLFEISVVDSPANPEATIEEVNRLAKSDTDSISEPVGDPMADEPETNPTTEKGVEEGGEAAEESTSTDITEVVNGLVDAVKTLSADVEALKATKAEPEEEETEEEDVEKSEDEAPAPLTAEDITKAVKDTVQAELRKMATDKPPATPRPDLKKHELTSPLQKALEKPDALANMSIREIDNLVDQVGE